MKLMLALPSSTGLLAAPPAAQGIDVYEDDELDGLTLVHAVLDLAPYIPVAVGSFAATLAAANKSIDEMRALFERFAKKAPVDDRSGLFESGRRVLAPDATDQEIDEYFSAFKRRAANARR
jgi:hypothetical protein